jgi:hypothetical protein
MLRGKMSVGRNVQGRVVHGTSCLSGEMSRGELFLGRGVMGRVAMGRIVRASFSKLTGFPAFQKRACLPVEREEKYH